MRAVLLVVLVAMAVLLVAWGVASLSWPYGGDQAWIGWVADVVAGGGRPYVDAWDNNSPGAYLQQAALQATFGHAEWPLRAVDLIYLALTAWALIALGKRYGPSHSGLWASAFFICTYAATGNSNTAQRDGWGAMLVTWALALVGGGGLAGTALAGLLAGLAFLMKPTFALFLVPLLVLLIGTRRSEENTAAAEASVDGSLARLPAGRLIALGVCFLIPLAVVAAWLAPGGGLAEAYRSVVVFNLNAEAGSWAPPIGAHRWGRFVLRLAVLLPALVLAALGLAHILARRTPGRWAIAVIYPAAGFALGALLPGRLSLYHWHAFLAPLALLAGVGIGALSDKASRSTGGRRAATSGLVLALVLGAFAGPAVGTGASVRWWATETLGHGKGRPGPGGVGVPSVPRYEERLGHYLAAHTAPGEPIQVWDWEPSVYYFAGRPCATRFGHNWPIILSEAHLPEMHRAFIAEFLSRLESVRPRYFVDGTRPGQSLRLSPEVEAYVLSHYHQVATFESYRIFTRDPGESGAGNSRWPGGGPGKGGG